MSLAALPATAQALAMSALLPSQMLPLDKPNAPTGKRLALRVTVTFEDGKQASYAGVYPSTFAAYDQAFDRYPTATRIEVKATQFSNSPPQKARA